MDKVFDRLADAVEETNRELKSTNGDIHAIRELIATGKGAWWGGTVIVTGALGLAGAIGAFVHKILP